MIEPEAVTDARNLVLTHALECIGADIRAMEDPSPDHDDKANAAEIELDRACVKLVRELSADLERRDAARSSG